MDGFGSSISKAMNASLAHIQFHEEREKEESEPLKNEISVLNLTFHLISREFFAQKSMKILSIFVLFISSSVKFKIIEQQLNVTQFVRTKAIQICSSSHSIIRKVE